MKLKLVPKAKTYQVTFELRAVNTMTQGQFGEALKESLEDALGDSLMNLSVREGLPLGARQLPEGTIETLQQRLEFINDLYCDGEGVGDELKSLIADIKKAEGIE